jgi:LPS-assembly protein
MMRGNRKLQNVRGEMPYSGTIVPILLVITLVSISLFFCSASRVSAEDEINIYADELEYLSESNTYSAKGSVEITYENATIHADEIHYNKRSGDAIATGNVIYEDAQVIVHADKLELNFDTQRGVLHKCTIFYKKGNYHVKSRRIEKIGEETYLMDDATATTCDAVPPDWHFSGKDVKITLQENVQAKHVTFYIKNVPVLYSPYFHAPLERQTGLLMPSFGHSNTKGFIFKQGFFWALKDNMDTTLYLDYFGKKGVGKGIDYRYIINTKTNGELWMYHLRDNDLLRDFFELKSYHNQKLPYDMSGYLKIHLVNEFDYYNVLDSTSYKRMGWSSRKSNPFGFTSEERLQKYLESNLHISKPFTGGRTYVLGQYRQSLEGGSGEIPQSLPEIGFIVNTRNLGMTFFNVEITGKNFWRENGQQGQRVDIYPNLYLSLGRIVNFTQKIGLRETLYILKDPSDNINRKLFDTRSILTTRFLKRYSSLIHIIEPSVEYAFIPDVEQGDIPGFDSVDSIPQTSDIIYSFTNRLTGTLLGSTEARLRFSQRYSLLDIERPFSPVQIETTFSSSTISVSANALFNVYDKNMEETFALVNLKSKKGFIGVGTNFRRSTSLEQYTLEAGLYKPIDIFGRALPIDISGKLWYDLKGGGVQEFNE